MQTVDIKPSPDGDGFCLHAGSAAAVWFSMEHHAVDYAQGAYPTATIRIFAGDMVIVRAISPRQ